MSVSGEASVRMADRLAWWRLSAIWMLGFASGLPLALTGQAMQAWLSIEHVDVATIGFLSLVGLPYTFKFIWAPLMDRFDWPWLGRRRGWIVFSQLALALSLFVLASISPTQTTRLFAVVAFLVAFLSASQDIVIDAYRTDLLAASERGLGSSVAVMGYRLAMIFSGGIVMVWTDPTNVMAGRGWSWPEVYRLMAGLMVLAAVLSALATPRLGQVASLDQRPLAEPKQPSAAAQDLIGFIAVIAALAVGLWLTDGVLKPLVKTLLQGPLQATSLRPDLQRKWVELVILLLGIGITLPLAGWAARLARFETLLGGLRQYFAQPGASSFLAFIVLYKLGDAFALSLLTPFLLQEMQFSPAAVGVVNKVLGLVLTIVGALLAGAWMLRLGLWRALLGFGVLQMLSNLGFWWLAWQGKGSLPELVVPAFDWGFVHLEQATPVDGGLLLAVALENLASGMGTAAFLAFLMSLCHQRFTATQFALLSAFASVGRVWVGPVAGVLAETIGWPVFFLLAMLLALPALAMLFWLKPQIQLLEQPFKAS